MSTRLEVAKELYGEDQRCICGHTLGDSHDNDETECEAFISEAPAA